MTANERNIADGLLELVLDLMENSEPKAFEIQAYLQNYHLILTASELRRIHGAEITSNQKCGSEGLLETTPAPKTRAKRAKSAGEKPSVAEALSETASQFEKALCVFDERTVPPILEPTSPDTSADPEPAAACNAAPQGTSEVSGDGNESQPVIAEPDTTEAVNAETENEKPETPEITLDSFRAVFFELQKALNPSGKFQPVKEKLLAVLKANGSPGGQLPQLPEENFQKAMDEFKAIRDEALQPAAE